MCPNVSRINVDDVSKILDELVQQKLIFLYSNAKGAVIQLLDWWDTNSKLQWAWPSDYPPLNGWKDHLRYKKGRETVVTDNWPAPQLSMPLSGEPDLARE